MADKERLALTARDSGGAEQGPVVGAKEAPDLFVDGYQGIAIHNGVVKFNLITVNMDPADGEVYRKVIAKLSMSMPTFLQFHAAMSNLVNDLESQGLIKRATGIDDERSSE